MKKILIYVIAAVCMVLMTACGGKNGKTGDFVDAGNITVNGVSVVPGSESSTAVDKLGEPVKYTEAASCYYDGMDKVYNYGDFEIRTCPAKDGKDIIQDICIMNGDYRAGLTELGIGSTFDEVKSAMNGHECKNTGSMYKYYYSDDAYLYFFMMNDTVKYFGYAIDVSN